MGDKEKSIHFEDSLDIIDRLQEMIAAYPTADDEDGDVTAFLVVLGIVAFGMLLVCVFVCIGVRYRIWCYEQKAIYKPEID